MSIFEEYGAFKQTEATKLSPLAEITEHLPGMFLHFNSFFPSTIQALHKPSVISNKLRVSHHSSLFV